ncbi:arginyltransferase [Idiomarina tyrosinivorans]|uniref:Aspartate/glutamate leucyltransferase n=1 Tax=Idiomarina tyrosinivorans TaxID=1445662 RepID=A0A432ZUH8_9GAMM|nr:arginyltransferase [Idiomarina tyrosinivorans]RUO81553.1 arginyltransferase [Idiomarina tyrosinivorans]
MQFGLTQNKTCGYLDEQQERLLVAVPDAEHPSSIASYHRLVSQGFRRSHNDLYRPYCDACNACQSIRVLVQDFSPSRRFRRIIKKNNDLIALAFSEPTAEHSELFCRFIEQRHADGAMYPPDPEAFWRWISCDWLAPLMLEWRDNNGRLLLVSIADRLPDAYSAVYSFFEPSAEKRSLGIFAILEQWRLAKQDNKGYLYLGYQIDACSKMNYKTQFAPYERLIGNQWQKAVKSTAT